MDLPDIVHEINKKKKAVKITTLEEARSFILKRFFSGSFGVDYITGGGFAYRRIQLLFGARSSGKNALLNQTTAYLQRQCRNCHAILPDFFNGTQAKDQWSFVMHNVMGMSICNCENPHPKRVFVLDFERALAIEEARTIKVLHITNSKTGEGVDELDYNDAFVHIGELRALESLTEEQKNKIKKYEEFIKLCSIKEQIINQIAITDYLKKCGVDVSKLLVADPEDTEEGIELVRDMIRAREVDAIIWDSLQAAIPRYVKDRDADQATMGIEAKQNGLLMRHVCSAFAAADLTDEKEAYKPALFITSQVRASLGGFASTPDTYSGGNAIQHHISLALEVKREKFLKQDGTDAEFKDDFYGQRVRLRADKNKLSSPGDMYEYEYFFREGDTFPVGIDSVGEVINMGVKTGLIDRAGPYYAVGDKKFQGMKALKDAFREDSKFAQGIYIQLMQKL
jgi:RecA/RadA recombinase